MHTSQHATSGRPAHARLRIAATGFAALCLFCSAHAQTIESANQAEAEPHQSVTKKHIGDTTNSILQAQANGSMAGAHLPILGPTATLSWQRYLESYKHPIPETFTRKLDEIGQR